MYALWSKHYVGLELVDFERTGDEKPISRVTLFIDDEQAYTAGDDTGRELSGFCPSATQAMADNLLNQLKGYVYRGFSATAADIDPAVELGDGVTAGGLYSVIAQSVDDDGYFDLAAPKEPETEEEYPFAGPIQQEQRRKNVELYSLIAKNNERITLEVGKITTELENYATIEMTAESIELAVSQSKIYTDGKYTELKVTLDGVTVTDSGGTTKIKGSSIETDTLYVKAANIEGELIAAKLQGDKVNVVSSSGIIYGEMSVAQNGALYILSGVASGFLLGGTNANPVVTCLGSFYAENIVADNIQAYLDGFETRISRLERLFG